MAVTEMKKFTAICQMQDTDKLIRKLMWLSCVDVKQKERESTQEITFEKLADIDSQIAEKTKLLERIKETTATLAKYDTKEWAEQITMKVKKKPFSAPVEVDFDEFIDSGRYEIAMVKLEKLQHLIKILATKKEEYNSIKDEYYNLVAWSKYDVRLDCHGTAFTQIILGTLGRNANTSAISKELCANYLAELYKINEDKHAQYVSVVTHKSATEDVLRLLSSKGFSQVALPEIDGDINDAVRVLEERVNKNLSDTRKVEEHIASFVGFERQLEIVYDITSTNIAELEAKKNLTKSGGVCIIDGWTPTASYEKVQSVFEKLGCAYEFSDPEKNEDVPVLLKNNPFASPFEPIISLYSMPKYKTFDPTFVMSIFYVIIFGLMFADVGYGIILSLGCLLMIKLLYPTGTLRKFFFMFAMCGLSCAIWGFILGGYLGDFPSTVLGIETDLALWFDPIQDPMTFLVLSIVVGAVHLIAGMIIKMVILIKQGQIFSAIFDVGSWIVVFVGIALAIISAKIGLIVAGVGVLMLILTQGRAQKNIFMKIVKGISSLYSITSYASDLLSYTRILALGLASAVIAKVVNIIATLGGESIIGYLLLIIVLLVGHTLNMAINILGTFVHASRLQYIEFFGKFYEEGGTPFNLLAPKNKYVLFKKKKDI